MEKLEQKSDESIGERVKLRIQRSDKLNEIITEKDEIINKELSKNYFHQFESLSGIQKKLFQTQNAQENGRIVHGIRDRATDLSNETKKMSKNENKKAN